MRLFRTAVATRCFAQPLITSIKSTAALDAKGVQFDVRTELRSTELTATGRRDLLHQISEFGLSVAGAVFPLNYPLYEESRIDARIVAIHDAMKFAYSLQASTLCLRVGKIPEEQSSKERQLLVEALNDLARYSNHIGTTLAITPTNDSAETLLALLSDIKSGPIGIDFDPAHFAMTGRPVTESLRTLHEFVVHVQLRDGDSGMRGGEERPVGHGNVDWIEVFALLGEMDYRGWLTAIRTEGNDRASDLRRGLALVKQLLTGG